MKIKELQILSNALNTSVIQDINFFASIQHFVQILVDIDFRNDSSKSDLLLCVEKIDSFFEKYNSSGNTIYSPPFQISNNNDTVKSIVKISGEILKMSESEMLMELNSLAPNIVLKSIGNKKIFLGHGRSNTWARVNNYLREELKLETNYFEEESRTSLSITQILIEFLNNTSLAIIIMTAEDETKNGEIRARQNVIHEVGLFQGRLGFDKVIILKEDGIEEFSNIAGLQYIPFQRNNVETCFYNLEKALKKAGIIPSLK